MDFSKTILRWYNDNKRDLPWRENRDPYSIWLSEIIMQQTRVEQGLPYYMAFIKKYPRPALLAKAPIDDILKLWQGLGYYSRARNLHQAAQTIVKEHQGVFPSDYDKILALKGVGEYTAAAVASIAFNLPYAVVDGNVYRLLSRVFGITLPVDSSAGKKKFRELAAELLYKKDPGTYNQAVMEFGALYCKPQNPDCEACIFSTICIAKEKKKVIEWPVKAQKTKVRDRYFQYLMIKHKNSTWLKKRKGKDIWEGLYEFPLIESDKPLSESKLIGSGEWNKWFPGEEAVIREVSVPYTHILSHQRIYARFWEIETTKKPKDKEWIETTMSKLHTYAVPRLIDRYLEERQESTE
jgi:A/G-specific adenine glycosylase